MNCDECKEQVFELIEREAVDADTVHEILARCPDCRAVFDEMKAALAVAEQLPIEEPPAALDAAILRAAAERGPRVVQIKKRRMQPAPWAMAAIAMLAVGVGVWTIPREVQFEGDEVPSDVAEVADLADLKDVEEVVIAEQRFEAEAPYGRKAEAEVASKGTAGAAQLRTLERDEAKQKKRSREPARAMKRSVPAASAAPSEPSAPSASAARESSAARGVRAADSAAAGDVALGSLEEAAAPRQQEQDEDDASVACQRKVDELERSVAADEDYAPTPEEALTIGKCYQALDNLAEARNWLERAAEHRETKARANRALRRLAPE